MWTDTLKLEEVIGTLRAAERLGAARWARPLLDHTKPILDRLRVGLTDKDAYGSNPLVPAEMSFLFEIRFAAALSPRPGCRLNTSTARAWETRQ